MPVDEFLPPVRHPYDELCEKFLKNLHHVQELNEVLEPVGAPLLHDVPGRLLPFCPSYADSDASRASSSIVNGNRGDFAFTESGSQAIYRPPSRLPFGISVPSVPSYPQWSLEPVVPGGGRNPLPKKGRKRKAPRLVHRYPGEKVHCGLIPPAEENNNGHYCAPDYDGLFAGGFPSHDSTSELTKKTVSPPKPPPFYGPPEDIPVGMWWSSRLDCSKDRVHCPTIAGIHGGPEGAYSIAMSGGYDENEDYGDHFWFCGEGGRDLVGTKNNPKNQRTADQTRDMVWSKGNTALYKSYERKTPVRVIRGFSKKKHCFSPWAPTLGYRYDGLYLVTEFEEISGVSGHKVFRFKFKRLEGQPPIQL